MMDRVSFRTCSLSLCTALTLACAAATSPADENSGLGDERLRVAPASAQPRFDSIPDEWGLREVAARMRLEDLDDTLLLYTMQRGRYLALSDSSPIYLVGGKQLITDAVLTDDDIEEILSTYACLCAMEYESTPDEERTLHMAAGVYRLTGAPTLDRTSDGVVRVDFEFDPDGQSDRGTLRRMTCWNADEESLRPLVIALPPFAVFAYKVKPDLADPVPDGRPVRQVQTVRNPDGDQASFVVSNDAFGFPLQYPDNVDTPKKEGVMRPGMWAWFQSITSGEDIPVDDRDFFYDDTSGAAARLNRSGGSHFRDRLLWP